MTAQGIPGQPQHGQNRHEQDDRVERGTRARTDAEGHEQGGKDESQQTNGRLPQIDKRGHDGRPHADNQHGLAPSQSQPGQQDAEQDDGEDDRRTDKPRVRRPTVQFVSQR